MFRCPDPVPWESHAQWYQKAVHDPGKAFYVAVLQGEPIGVVRFDIRDGRAEISINLNPDFRGRSLSPKVMQAAIDRFIIEHSVRQITAEVKVINAASISCVLACGFRPTCERDGMIHYIRN